MHNILFLTGRLSGGGAERVACVLSNEFSKENNVTILRGHSNEDKTFELGDSIVVNDLNFNYEKTTIFNNILEYVNRLYKVRSIYRKGNFDIALGIKEDSAIRLCLSLFFTPCKVIACEHNHYYAMKSKAKRLFRNLVYFFCADKVVILTNDDVINYPFFLKHKLQVINNPLGINGYSPTVTDKVKNTPMRFLAVGRLEYQKGFDRLLNIMKNIKDKYNQDWFLDIIGEGSLYNNLISIISEYGLERHVNILPYSNEMESTYNKYDILLMTSYWEGLPMVLGEAMSCGLPVIAFDCKTGPNCFVIDNKNGFLIEDGNELEFESAVLKMLKMHDNDFNLFRVNARNSSQKFSSENIVNLWFNLFKDLIEK